MVGRIWSVLVLAALVCAAWTGRLGETGEAAVTGAGEAAELVLVLAGGYAFWGGLLRVAEDAGAMRVLARVLRRPVRALFGRVGDETEEKLVENLSANMLGLGNAATPPGLSAMRRMGKAMQDGRATDAMCMFLVLNASSVQLLPTSVLVLRQAAGSAAPAEIVMPTLIATAVSSLVGVALCRVCAHRGNGR